MCQVSDKMKLCSCATSIDKLQHYWIFHRYAKGNNHTIMGEAVMPHQLSPEVQMINRKTLQEIINDADLFDVDLKPHDKDRLQLTFTVLEGAVGDGSFLNYGFEYRKDKWVMIPYDVFDWMSNHEEVGFGKIDHALKQ